MQKIKVFPPASSDFDLKLAKSIEFELLRVKPIYFIDPD